MRNVLRTFFWEWWVHIREKLRKKIMFLSFPVPIIMLVVQTPKPLVTTRNLYFTVVFGTERIRLSTDLKSSSTLGTNAIRIFGPFLSGIVHRFWFPCFFYRKKGFSRTVYRPKRGFPTRSRCVFCHPGFYSWGVRMGENLICNKLHLDTVRVRIRR